MTLVLETCPVVVVLFALVLVLGLALAFEAVLRLLVAVDGKIINRLMVPRPYSA